MLLNALTQALYMLYVFCAVLLLTYIGGFVVLLSVHMLARRRTPVPTPTTGVWPRVLVQLPLYNERAVAMRLLDAVAALDYPRAALCVQVLDDSDDDSANDTADAVARLRADGLDVTHVRRGTRAGYKAGALAYGLALSDAPFVAVFDADFVPSPSFLKDVLPTLLADARLGAVQARWAHLNEGASPLTMAQALSVDGHFAVEQPARVDGGLLLTFNGSAGVWRTEAIVAAGGWRADTLTEDLDLSYRAQLSGWRLAVLPDVAVPSELPDRLASYRQQQARWARGNTQCLRVLAGPLWRAPRVSWAQKVMGTLHLGQYVPQLLLVMLLVLTPPLAAAGRLRGVVPAALGLAALVPPLVIIAGQRALHPTNWQRRLLALPALVLLGSSLALYNAMAVVRGLVGARGGAFLRTPKGGQGSAVRGLPWPEMLTAFYALISAVLLEERAPAVAPYLFLTGLACALAALWLLLEQAHAKRAQADARC